MHKFLPQLFSFLVSGAVAGAVITLLVSGGMDALSRVSWLRVGRRHTQADRS